MSFYFPISRAAVIHSVPNNNCLMYNAPSPSLHVGGALDIFIAKSLSSCLIAQYAFANIDQVDRLSFRALFCVLKLAFTLWVAAFASCVWNLGRTCVSLYYCFREVSCVMRIMGLINGWFRVPNANVTTSCCVVFFCVNVRLLQLGLGTEVYGVNLIISF